MPRKDSHFHGVYILVVEIDFFKCVHSLISDAGKCFEGTERDKWEGVIGLG